MLQLELLSIFLLSHGLSMHASSSNETQALPALVSASISGRIAVSSATREKSSGVSLTGPSARTETSQRSGELPAEVPKPSPRKQPTPLLEYIFAWPPSITL